MVMDPYPPEAKSWNTLVASDNMAKSFEVEQSGSEFLVAKVHRKRGKMQG